MKNTTTTILWYMYIDKTSISAKYTVKLLYVYFVVYIFLQVFVEINYTPGKRYKNEYHRHTHTHNTL